VRQAPEWPRNPFQLGAGLPLDAGVIKARDTRRVPLEPPEGWEEVEGALQREFRFNDFPRAIDFVNRVAEVAEEANHHPDIVIEWNRVTLRWATHATGAVTGSDIEMAERTNALV
jgi:4a-hydroxytetrahydrobiopterin dehydratase